MNTNRPSTQSTSVSLNAAGMVLEEWPFLQPTRRFGRHSIPSRSSFLKLNTPGRIGSQNVAIL